MRKWVVLCLLTTLGLRAAWSDMPQQFVYTVEGYEENEEPYTGWVGLQLKLYTNSTGGSALFEDSNTVYVTDGYFSTIVGDDPVDGSLADAVAGGSAYVEVVINGSTWGSREQVVPSAFALRADGVLESRITASMIATGSVQQQHIAAGAVKAVHVDEGAISSWHVQDGSIAVADMDTEDTDARYVNTAGDIMTGDLIVGTISNLSLLDFDGTSVTVGRSASSGSAGVAVGYRANGYCGAAVGASSTGSLYSAAVGRQSFATDYAAALGSWATASNGGVAVGAYAKGYTYSVAVGRNANSSPRGVAVGFNAHAWDTGVAIGNNASGSVYGVAVGTLAVAPGTNIAIGLRARALGGNDRISIGCGVTNEVDNSAMIRGNLYLEGATGILHRATFGTGEWQLLAAAGQATNIVLRTGDTMSGSLAINASASETNLIVSGWALLTYIPPQGGLSMGTFTNGLPQ